MATPAREVRATGVAFLKRATSARFRRRTHIRLPRATPALLKAPRGRLLSSALNGTKLIEGRKYVLREVEVEVEDENGGRKDFAGAAEEENLIMLKY